jgi:hypothetical protein
MNTMQQLAAFAFLATGLVGVASAAPNDWAEGTGGRGGASRDYYNSAGSLAWKNRLGDWRDGRDAAQGDAPYAVATVSGAAKGSFVEWDVTPLVPEWSRGTFPNQGFFLRVVKGQGSFQFASREDEDAARRPQLVLTGDAGVVTRTPQADTYLDSSTYRSLGHLNVLRISPSPNHVLLRFELGGVKPRKASLRLFNTAQTSGANADIGVFRCRQGHEVPDQEPILGLAAKYPKDQGLAKDLDVVFFTDFEADSWRDEWSQVANRNASETVAADAARKFEPLAGRALSANLAKGESTALNTLFKFKDKTSAEPDEMFFRYYLRLGDDWNQTVDGGKLPGFSGTYGKAGWGGRKVDGTDGWSARGSFGLAIPEGNPLAGLQPIGTYCYHAEMRGTYGDVWVWQRGYRGFLEKNRWYCIEQQVKLNQPERNDGILRAWVDGRLAFEKTDIRFRTVATLKIEQVWMNVYHGGTKPSPYDQHLFIDNVVIARKYIGPRRDG